jgi:hypothetical protein
MKLRGANQAPEIIGLDELPGKSNYFIGENPQAWRRNVAAYTKIKYKDVYPGIDLQYHGNRRQLEYDFIVAPGADPRAIGLSFEGARKLEVDPHGDLVLHTTVGQVRQNKPAIYQDVDGVMKEISGGFRLEGENQVGFQISAYDTRKPLLIDPVLVYSTYLGGSLDEEGMGIAVDSSGSAYVAGSTYSQDFPTANACNRPTPPAGMFFWRS